MLALLYARLYRAVASVHNSVGSWWSNFTRTIGSVPIWDHVPSIADVILAVIAFVAPSVTNVDPMQHNRLIRTLRWTVWLVVAILAAILAARLPFDLLF